MTSDIEKAVAALSLTHGLLDTAQAMRLVADLKEDLKPAVDLLLERVAETDLLKAISEELGLRFYDLYSTEQLYRVDDDLLERADITYLRKYSALPMIDRTGHVVVAIAFPDPNMRDYLRRVYPETFSMVVAPKTQIQDRLAYLYADQAASNLSADTLLSGTSTSTTAQGNLPRVTGSRNAILDFVDSMLARAVAAGASDIHIGFNADKTIQVRFRIDGILRRHRVNFPGREMEIVSSLLTKCDSIDSSNTREPADGTFSFNAAGRQIDSRVSMLPQVNGPKVVIRLLDSRNMRTRLDDMGFATHHLTTMRTATSQPQGTVIVCGPTGSGKSTTLYGLVKEVDAESKNVVTVEDPVEYRLPNIGQTAIRSDLGTRSLTFARALRSILRQDPDIILVGEIRDEETARVAMDAAITGHLVLTTLHAPSAIGVYTRLIEMGVPTYMVAEAVTLTVSQRLIRRVHECARLEVPTKDERAWFAEMNLPLPDRVPHIAGCQGCNGTGYRGRIAVVELLEPTRAFKSLVASHAPYETLLEQAMKDGFRPIQENGLSHVMSGQTTVSEAVRVLASVEDI